MTKRMLVDARHPDETRVVIADSKQIFDYDYITASKKQVKGNIYLAKITRVEPSLQAAFVEYGGGKQGFLPFSEIHADYYQIPTSDREKLLKEEQRAADAASESEEDEVEEETAANEDASTEDAAELPELMEIPKPDFRKGKKKDESDEADAADEEPSAESDKPARESMVAMKNSEIVSRNDSENEELAEKLKSQDAENGSDKGDVDTIDSEDEEISKRKKRNNFYRRYKIQEVIKSGQIVLVQVIKEERGNKGVSLSTYLSLAGRYCVLMPNSPKDGGISRKISDASVRKRLKEILAELKLTAGMSVIIRTAGIDRTRPEIRRDFEYLVKLWNQIREGTLAANAPSLIYEESDLIKRSIRDLYSNDIEEVMIEGEEAFKSARAFMKMLLPSHTPRIKQYNDDTPLLYAYGVEEQLLSMYDPMVKLKSGGYLIINPTEALISIDINSGRSTSERNIEETATKTNLEAAYEIARQLRLRDLAGLVVIDFIDMMDSRNRRNVERALKDALKSDRAKIQLGRISPFGLLEMSRQRLRPSISESHTVQCPHCTGRGVVRSNESMSIQILRTLEREASTGNWQMLKLNVQEHVALYLINHKRDMLAAIESAYDVKVELCIDHELTASSCTVEKMRRSGGGGGSSKRFSSDGEDDSSRSGRRRGRGRKRRDDADSESSSDTGTENDSTSDDSSEEDEEGRSRSRRRRGRRGGRGRRRNNENTGDNDNNSDSDSEDTSEEVAADDSSDDKDASESKSGSRNRRGRRGGRGRKRWQDEEGSEDDGGDNITADKEENDDSAKKSTGRRRTTKSTSDEEKKVEKKDESLPEFTRSNVVESRNDSPSKKPANDMPERSPHTLETTKRPDGVPARKGWWQKMIELD